MQQSLKTELNVYSLLSASTYKERNCQYSCSKLFCRNEKAVPASLLRLQLHLSCNAIGGAWKQNSARWQKNSARSNKTQNRKSFGAQGFINDRTSRVRLLQSHLNLYKTKLDSKHVVLMKWHIISLGSKLRTNCKSDTLNKLQPAEWLVSFHASLNLWWR